MDAAGCEVVGGAEVGEGAAEGVEGGSVGGGTAGILQDAKYRQPPLFVR